MTKSKVLSFRDFYLPRTILVLAAFCLILGVLYVAFLINSFQHVYERQAGAQLLNLLRADVSTLETEYNLALTNNLTTEVAYARGFHDVSTALAYVAVQRQPTVSDLALRVTP